MVTLRMEAVRVFEGRSPSRQARGTAALIHIGFAPMSIPGYVNKPSG
jgi:hypothetical protein